MRTTPHRRRIGWRAARVAIAALLLGSLAATAGQPLVGLASAQAADTTPTTPLVRKAVSPQVPTYRSASVEVPAVYRYNDVSYELSDINGGVIAVSGGIPANEGMHWDFADTTRDRGNVYVRAGLNTGTALLPTWSAWSPRALMMNWADVPAAKTHLKIVSLSDSVG